MDQDILFFFQQDLQALPLYELLEERILQEFPDVQIKAQKTQISFYNRHMFACVSFLKVRRACQRPPHFIVVTFGLNYRLSSPRIDAAVQPHPNRWTHHILISSPDQIDEELLSWIRQAAAFSAG